jgi:hypothetical protein
MELTIILIFRNLDTHFLIEDTERETDSLFSSATALSQMEEAHLIDSDSRRREKRNVFDLHTRRDCVIFRLNESQAIVKELYVDFTGKLCGVIGIKVDQCQRIRRLPGSRIGDEIRILHFLQDAPHDKTAILLHFCNEFIPGPEAPREERETDNSACHDGNHCSEEE